MVDNSGKSFKPCASPISFTTIPKNKIKRKKKEREKVNKINTLSHHAESGRDIEKI